MTAQERVSTREMTLKLLLKNGELSSFELANNIGISVQAMRRQLRCMENDGLVQANQKVKGPGRPSNNWELTEAGYKFFNDGSERFSLDLLKTLNNGLPSEVVENLLHQQALKKADQYCSLIGMGGIEERLLKLLELRRKDGFLSECIPDERGNGWFLNEYHCSVRKIAEAYPCVCDQELQVLRHTLPDCNVERVNWRIEEGHTCGFHVNLKEIDG